MEKQVIRAVFDEKTIRVYQAFNELISSEAVRSGTFGKGFKMNRMTWIKPSFLWMMYRCGWASKSNQEHVLAIDIKRSGFDYMVNNAIPSTYIVDRYKSRQDWQNQLKSSDIICQWDPERDIFGNPLNYRSIQIGIRDEVLSLYVDHWIVSIEDITNYVLDLKNKVDLKQDITHFLPKEEVYDIDV